MGEAVGKPGVGDTVRRQLTKPDRLAPVGAAYSSSLTISSKSDLTERRYPPQWPLRGRREWQSPAAPTDRAVKSASGSTPWRDIRVISSASLPGWRKNGSFCRPRYGKRRGGPLPPRRHQSRLMKSQDPHPAGQCGPPSGRSTGWGSTVGWRALLQATDGRWQSPPVDNYRVCCTIGVDGDPGGLNRNIRDFTGFTNANHKADVPARSTRYRKRSR